MQLLQGQVPVLWSGDGMAKWMCPLKGMQKHLKAPCRYLLALDALSLSCQSVARLILLSHPTDLLERLFSAFEATQLPGSIAPREKKGGSHQKGPSSWLGESIFESHGVLVVPHRAFGAMPWLKARAPRKAIAPLERNIKPDEFISFKGGGRRVTSLHRSFWHIM